MKKFIAFITVALCIALFVGCGKEKAVDAEGWVYLTFEEAVQQSTNIVEATYVGGKFDGKYYEYRFTVDKQFCGSTEDDTIYVYGNGGVHYGCLAYFDDENKYEIGKTYLLLLRREKSVYYDHDRYIPFVDIFIPTDDVTKAEMYRHDIKWKSESGEDVFSDMESVENYISKLISECKKPKKEYWGNEYIESDNLAEIAEKSDCLLRVTPTELVESLDYEGTETYTCRVDEVYSGKFNRRETDIVFFGGTVDIGKSYTVALNRSPQDTALELSSKNSLCTTQEQADIMISAVK